VYLSKCLNVKMVNKPCIRVFADKEQINQCKIDILHSESSIQSVGNALSLSGNEVRLKILFLLNREGKMCPCDLSDILEMTVPAISQHLRKLKDGGLVSTKKVGQTIFYSIVEDHRNILDPILSLVEIKTVY
jgi:ArsR family transcriptional regulator, lead/cadmium/zinc/bismuth-responsive transcriptional repressor